MIRKSSTKTGAFKLYTKSVVMIIKKFKDSDFKS